MPSVGLRSSHSHSVPHPWLDLGNQIAHLAVVDHAPELTVELRRVTCGHAIDAACPPAILARSVLAEVWVGGPPMFS